MFVIPQIYHTNREDLFIDDFSSDEDDDDDENIKSPRCKALYPYSAKLNDELSLEPGKSNIEILADVIGGSVCVHFYR